MCYSHKFGGCVEYQDIYFIRTTITQTSVSLDICTLQGHSDMATLRSSQVSTTVGCLHCEGVGLTSSWHCPSWACVIVSTISESLEGVNTSTQVIWTRYVDKVGIKCLTHVQWWFFPCNSEMLSWEKKWYSWSPWSGWMVWQQNEYKELGHI